MKRFALLLIFVVFVMAVLNIVRMRHGSPPVAAQRLPAPPSEARRPARIPAPPNNEPAYFPPVDRLNDPRATVDDDLRIVASVFQGFQEAVKDPSGNPIGDNAEIVRALQGNNRGHIVFIPSNHPALNARGELLDRWGTPYFFHALSGFHMEIHSAGPDRKMWTEDDVVFPPAP